MARSYHVTKKEAAKRLAQGDAMPTVQFAEKRNLKKVHKKFRKIYAAIHPSEKPAGLRNSVTQSALKKVMKAKNKKFIKEKS